MAPVVLFMDTPAGSDPTTENVNGDCPPDILGVALNPTPSVDRGNPPANEMVRVWTAVAPLKTENDNGPDDGMGPLMPDVPAGTRDPPA